MLFVEVGGVLFVVLVFVSDENCLLCDYMLG